MIDFKYGNLLEADVEALVNTVNTVGIMGKGIALQFRKAFPQNFNVYAKAAKKGELKLGKMFVFQRTELSGPHFIINFPTKSHWKSKSRLEEIQAGLNDLVKTIKQYHIKSVALPPLGCGNGGLDWKDVKGLIEKAASQLPEVSFLVYPPQEAPKAEAMKIATKRPNWTAASAALIGVLDRYSLPGYRLTMLEIQKLAYFLQETGEQMKLQFVKEKYGPYAENLHHWLQGLDGHFISGYGDRSRNTVIELIPKAVEESRVILKDNITAQVRFETVTDFIEGYETPYGLELLSTLHWLGKEDVEVTTNDGYAVKSVHSWNEHKRKTFKPEHIKIGWKRLNDFSWLKPYVGN